MDTCSTKQSPQTYSSLCWPCNGKAESAGIKSSLWSKAVYFGWCTLHATSVKACGFCLTAHWFCKVKAKLYYLCLKGLGFLLLYKFWDHGICVSRQQYNRWCSKTEAIVLTMLNHVTASIVVCVSYHKSWPLTVIPWSEEQQYRESWSASENRRPTESGDSAHLDYPWIYYSAEEGCNWLALFNSYKHCTRVLLNKNI